MRLYIRGRFDGDDKRLRVRVCQSIDGNGDTPNGNEVTNDDTNNTK